MCAVEEERLSEIDLRQKKAAACTVMLCSRGYPEKYETGFPVSGLDTALDVDTFIFHSGTKIKNGRLVTAGGRVLGVTAVRDTLQTAVNAAYTAAEKVHFENRYFRGDIGAAALQVETL